MKHERRRLDVAISSIQALMTGNGEVGPEFPLLFRSMSQAPSALVGRITWPRASKWLDSLRRCGGEPAVWNSTLVVKQARPVRLISHRQHSQRALWLLVSERETNGELSSRLFAFTTIGVSWSERRSLFCGNAPSITLAGECLPSCQQLNGALCDPFELNGGVILTNSLPFRDKPLWRGSDTGISLFAVCWRHIGETFEEYRLSFRRQAAAPRRSKRA